MSARPESETRAWPPDVHLIGCVGANAGDSAREADTMIASLGFKAYGLLRMSALGLPVPPAFVLGTSYCADDAARERATDRATWAPALRAVEAACGRRFGDPHAPLLVAVRSGAPVSMPGMLGTLLDIGLSDATVGGMLRQTGNPRLVWDTYRRLVANYGELVAGIAPQVFESEYRALAGPGDERAPLDFAQLRELTRRSLAAYEKAAGRPFPQDPRAQLAGAIAAVLASWQSDKARAFRRESRIGDALGTAVTVQTMVFGNGGGRSGAGVGFTRDPATGEPSLWVDFLFNAQGEDVVSGRREAYGHEALSQVMPGVWQALSDAAATLERAFGDMQDFEFTVEDARLYLLQTRSGKRTPQAAARIALDLLDEGVIDAHRARERTAHLEPAALTRTRVASRDGGTLTPLAHAASASTGVACGAIALDEAAARERHAAGTPVILVRPDADTGDLVALQASAGLLTRHGARTSHAAVVARQLGKVCLTGCDALVIDEPARALRINGTVLREGQHITLDGNDGAIYEGDAYTVTEPLADLQARLARLRAGQAPGA
jgi:pyruvate,orthophosphate dikinase